MSDDESGTGTGAGAGPGRGGRGRGGGTGGGRPRSPGGAGGGGPRGGAPGGGPRGGGPRGGGPRAGGPGADGPRSGGPRDGGPRAAGPAAGAGARAGGAGRRSGPDRQRWSTQKPSQRSRGGGPAREVAFDVLTAVREEDAYANLVLPALLRKHRLDAREASLATELAYGTLRGRGLYDAVLAACTDRALAQVDPPLLDALRLGVHQLLATRVPPHAAVSQTVGLVRTRVGPGAGGFANAVLRRVAEHDRDAWAGRVAPEDGDPTERLAVLHSHPAWVVRALREALVTHGRDVGELEALLRADNAAPEVVLAARPGLSTPEELVAAAGAAVLRTTSGAWSPQAVRLEEGDPGALAPVRDGRARVQDEGSQLVALALAAAPLEGRDERWLDLCAGPGGKAALLSAAGAARGARLTAVEVSEHRARLVAQALAAGPDVDVRTGDGRAVGDDEPGGYDRVLVDAPCTGLGALRRRPEARWRRQPSDLSGLGPLQRDLLASALAAVRVGGVVAYVTCSPHPAETVAVVRDAVRRGAVELLDAPAVLDAAALSPVPGTAPPVDEGTGRDGGGRTAQLWPHAHGTDAMFLALLRRTA
ncbi:transcription antitermination factor NusB [Pseudokineococcus marinus]|uniref:RsmB/NOP family class I SAM-dependent RNA methyltransferase n=1 Tax=Pseudokineococcus marinus TaxID=351215 RepID=UPI0031D44573